MIGWRSYRKHVWTVIGGTAVLLAAGAPDLRAETTRERDLATVGRALRQYAEDMGAALTADLAAASMTMIGGHPGPVDPPPVPPVPPPVPPPPPVVAGGPVPVPPPPVPVAGPPVPPIGNPIPQGGPPPAASPEPAAIVTGLVGAGIASIAGWRARRKQRRSA